MNERGETDQEYPGVPNATVTACIHRENQCFTPINGAEKECSYEHPERFTDSINRP